MLKAAITARLFKNIKVEMTYGAFLSLKVPEQAGPASDYI
jgi:hypothetical protein